MNDQIKTYDHSATYSPEDDKIRLYFASRIPKPEWDALKKEGFSWCMKQAETGGCDMAATWTTAREDAALAMCGEIEDEDQPLAERSAQRAERFAGYGEKRLDEANAHADRYDAGPRVHGYQDAHRAERSAARHDRIADKATNQWDKAEYWSRRTSRVIAHALHKSDAVTRLNRIKGIEADIRRIDADNTPQETVESAEYVRRYVGAEYVARGHDCVGLFGQGRGRYYRSWNKAEGVKLTSPRTREHLAMRLVYETQMLDAQGGAGAAQALEVEVAGWFGDRQVCKITKDKAGRLNNVAFVLPANVKDADGTLNWAVYSHYRARKASKLDMDTYRAPTPEEKETFFALVKAQKAKAPKDAPILNPSREDAAKIQAVWNAKEKDGTMAPMELTQKQYTARSSGTYGNYEAVHVGHDWMPLGSRATLKDAAFRLRVGPMGSYYQARPVIVLTDKKAHKIPAQVTHAAV